MVAGFQQDERARRCIEPGHWLAPTRADCQWGAQLYGVRRFVSLRGVVIDWERPDAERATSGFPGGRDLALPGRALPLARARKEALDDLTCRERITGLQQALERRFHLARLERRLRVGAERLDGFTLPRLKLAEHNSPEELERGGGATGVEPGTDCRQQVEELTPSLITEPLPVQRALK